MIFRGEPLRYRGPAQPDIKGVQKGLLLVSFFKTLSIGTLAVGLSLGAMSVGHAEDRSHRAERLVSTLKLDAHKILSEPDKSLDERETHLAEAIRNRFHIAFIGEFVVGPTWDNLSDAQQSEFLELFGDFFLRAYSGQLGGYAEDELVIVSAAKKGSKDSFVVTTLSRPKRQTSTVRWRIREFDEKPLVIDILIDGTSVALDHRAGFHRVLENDGIDGLITLLKIRAERLSAQPSG